MKNKMFYGLILSFFLVSCGAEETTESDVTSENTVETEVVEEQEQEQEATIAKDVSAEEFKELISAEGAIILDVRTPGEFEGGYIEGAINIDYNSPDFETQIEELDKSQAIYIYCASGGRSSKAMSLMADKGFVELYNLLGGYGGWPYKG